MQVAYDLWVAEKASKAMIRKIKPVSPARFDTVAA